MRCYEHWLHAYVRHTRFSESPTPYHFWTGVATIAGALRRRVWIDEREFQWTPNFYIILVGPPGIVAKSTSIRGGMSLLEQVPGVKLGPQSVTWQALTQALEEAQDAVIVPGFPDPKVMSCITIAISELGTFLRPENRELLDVLIPLWDGQCESWGRRTKTQGSTVILNPWLNIVGCTTPAWLKDNFPQVLVGGGLTSRIVFVYADKKRQLVPYPSQIITSSDYKTEREHLLADLLRIAELAGEFELTPEAREYGSQWYDNHWHGPRDTIVASERFEGYWARKQTHIHKLAMVLSASKRDSLLITKEDLEEAVYHITALEKDMQKVFSSIGVANSAKVATEVLSLIKNAGSIKYRELWQQCYHTMDSKLFKDAVNSSISAGYVKQSPVEGDMLLTYAGKKPR